MNMKSNLKLPTNPQRGFRFDELRVSTRKFSTDPLAAFSEEIVDWMIIELIAHTLHQKLHDSQKN